MNIWTDHLGKTWTVPQVRGRLKFNRSARNRALREFVFHRDGYRCKHCGSTDLIRLVPDHIVSRRNGGSHHPDNLQTLCDPCNARKANLVDAKVGRLP